MLVVFVLVSVVAATTKTDNQVAGSNLLVHRSISPAHINKRMLAYVTVSTPNELAQQRQRLASVLGLVRKPMTAALMGKRIHSKRNSFGMGSGESFDSTSIGLGDFESFDMNSNKAQVRGSGIGYNNEKRNHYGSNDGYDLKADSSNQQQKQQQQQQQQLVLRELQDRVLRRIVHESLMEDSVRERELRSLMHSLGSNISDSINRDIEPSVLVPLASKHSIPQLASPVASTNQSAGEGEEGDAESDNEDGNLSEDDNERAIIRLVRRRKQLRWPQEQQD